MAVLSIDLAHKTYADIGAAVLDSCRDTIICRPVQIPLEGDPSPGSLGDYLHAFCRTEAIGLVLLDGPQGWKSEESELQHSRRCERELNTPAKTGELHSVKPKGYTNFVEFSTAVYNALAGHGWHRLAEIGSRPAELTMVETFPLSAWRKLGLMPLPSKRRARPEHINACLQELCGIFPLTVIGVPNHDQLQAIVAGLAGIAIEKGDWNACLFSGVAPTVEGGVWREGWIVNRKRP